MAEQETKEMTQQVADAAAHSIASVLERFDLADDAKIVSALSKRVMQGFTYKVNGKHGLSSAGVLWACREFAKQGEVYRVVGDLKIQPCPLDPECLNVWVIVQRFFVNPATGQEIALDSTIGHKRMSRKTKRYKSDDSDEFEMVEDPEFTTKAITKAERNGKKKLMPSDAVTMMVAKASGQSAAPPAASRSAARPPQGAQPTQAAKPATTGGAPAGGAPADAAKPADPKAAAATKPADTKPADAAAKPADTKPADAAKPADATKPAEAAKPAAAPAEPAGKPKMSKEVMVQKLDAVCKLVFQTQDGALARQRLSAITGKASPADLSEEEIKNVGNAINAVVKKTAVIEGNNIIRISDKAILWKGPDLPPPQEAPSEEGAKEGDMF